MKYISFVVPSYNSEAYLNKCVDSLLLGGEDVEIIIVNDGSKDNTINIANEYRAKYPQIVKVVDKENGGHGSGLNAGMRVATGVYYKCVDSDDWVDAEAYKKLLEVIKTNYEKEIIPDLYFTNYVYERLDANIQCPERLGNKVPQDKLFSWKETKKFGVAQFLMMHMLIYKLDILKQAKTFVPEKTFYVDNYFVYQPLYYVNTMYYVNVDFYRYYVGRPGQSVNYANMTKRYKEQLKVMREMVLAYTYDELRSLGRKHYRYMIHDLNVKLYMNSFFVYADFNKEKQENYKLFWKEFKSKNKKLYNKMRYRTSFVFSLMLIRPLRIIATKIGYNQINKNRRYN